MATIFQQLQQKFNQLIKPYKAPPPLPKKSASQTKKASPPFSTAGAKAKQVASTVVNTKIPITNLIPMPGANLLTPFVKNKVPNVTPRQVINKTADVTTRPIARIGFEGTQSLLGDKKVYKPQGKVAKALLGTEKLRNVQDAKRPAAEFLRKRGFNEDQVKKYAPLLIAAGVVGDLTVVSGGGAKKNAVKKGVGLIDDAEAASKFGRELRNAGQAKRNEAFVKELEILRGLSKNLLDQPGKDIVFENKVVPKGHSPVLKRVRDLVELMKDESGFINFGAKIGGEAKTPLKETPEILKGQDVSSTQMAKSTGNLLEQPKQIIQETEQSLRKGAEDLMKTISSSGDISKVSPYVNTNNMNISPEARQVFDKTIDEVRPRIEKKIGQTLTNEEAIDLANTSSAVLHGAVSRETTLKQEAAALRLAQDLAASAQSGQVDKPFIDNLIALKTYRTHIARQLQAMGIGADAKQRTAKELIMDAVMSENKNIDEVLEAAKGVDFNDANQASEFYRKFIKPKKSEWIDLLRYNSMLSSPNTHLINASSNYQGTGIIAPIEKTLTGFIDFLGSTARGKPRSYLMGEGASYAKGYYTNLGNATKKFAEVMSGKQPNFNPDMRMIPLASKGVKGALFNVLDFPLRSLEAADQFFTTMTQAGEKAALNYKQSKGVKVADNLDLKALEDAKRRVFRGELGGKDQGYILGAFDTVGEHLNSLRKHENPVVSTIAKFTIPFLNTPLNVLKQGIEYSPAGVLTLFGNKTKTEQLAKIALGTSAAIGSAALLSSGRTTWKEPVDAKKKAAFRAAGMQPYSVKVGDKWISYSKLHPSLAFNLALVSALHDAQENKTLDENQVNTVLKTTAGLANFYVDQSYVKNIGDIVSSAQGDVEGYARLLSNYPTQMIPFRALSSWINRIVDPVQRKQDPDGSILKKQMQQIMMQFPGLSKKVPERIGPDGQPIKNTNTLINAFSPTRVTTENPKNKELYNDMLRIQRINKESGKSGILTEGQIKLRQQQEELNYTDVDRSIKSMSKVDRAKFFDQKLKSAKTDDDVQKILTEYSQKGLLTPDVVREMIKGGGQGAVSVPSKISSTLPMAGKTEEVKQRKGEDTYSFIKRKIAAAEKQLKPLYDDVVKDTKKMTAYVKDHPEFYEQPRSLIAFELGNKTTGVGPEGDYSFYEYLMKNSDEDQKAKINELLSIDSNRKLEEKRIKRQRLIKLAQAFPLSSTYFQRNLRKDLISSFSRG